MVMNPILACQDKLLRVLNNDGKTSLYTHQFEAACVTISQAPELSARQSPIIGYGLSNGEIGVIELMRGQPSVQWSLEVGQLTDSSPVSMVKACSLGKQAQPKPKRDNSLDALADESEPEPCDLIVARDNGKIEIYSYQFGNPFPTLCFENQIKNTITGIDVGHVTMANSKDIILACYDGKILALVDSKKFKRQGIMGQENQNEIENV